MNGRRAAAEHLEPCLHMGEWGLLRIGRTYYMRGFFNEIRQTPSFPRPEDLRESQVTIICLGPKSSVSMAAKVRYRNTEGKGAWINRTRNARVFGGKELAAWFQENLTVGEEFQVGLPPFAEKVSFPEASSIKSSSGRTSGGNIPSGKIAEAYRDLYFLTLVHANSKTLVLTNPEFYDIFRKVSDGKVAEGIEILLVEA